MFVKSNSTCVKNQHEPALCALWKSLRTGLKSVIYLLHKTKLPNCVLQRSCVNPSSYGRSIGGTLTVCLISKKLKLMEWLWWPNCIANRVGNNYVKLPAARLKGLRRAFYSPPIFFRRPGLGGICCIAPECHEIMHSQQKAWLERDPELWVRPIQHCPRWCKNVHSQQNACVRQCVNKMGVKITPIPITVNICQVEHAKQFFFYFLSLACSLHLCCTSHNAADLLIASINGTDLICIYVSSLMCFFVILDVITNRINLNTRAKNSPWCAMW